VDAIAPNISKDAPVVAYCAVGYRSAALVKRMTMAGFIHAQVLDGGIFAWGNEHHPLVRDDERATQVHPYTQFWGRLLNDDVRARPPYN
jgi:3-mercaptopyruvate sulfurtransferase SseA